MNMFLHHPSLPINLRHCVTQPFVTLPSNPNALTASSTVSSAIALYIVHFPPAIVNNPDSDTWII